VKITAVMVATYMIDCCLIRTKPCKYFQLNSPWFNERKGVFSKMDLDRLIPERWRLQQRYDDGVSTPGSFPVFLKPEWSENAKGIHRADNPEELRLIRQKIAASKAPYLLQEGASHRREFEIFCLRDYRDSSRYSVFSITETINRREPNPINSIHNRDTHYQDLTDQFSEEQKSVVYGYLNRIGPFAISRLSVRAQSPQQLVAGHFQVIELNLYTPMPIHMLDPKYRLRDLWKMIRQTMMSLARLTRARDKSLVEKPVYTQIMRYNRKGIFTHFKRE